jgi:hypothetical protein
VVKLAREILEIESQFSMRGKVVFTFDVNVNTALFLASTRCSEVVIRREAIALLLKYPRRERLLVTMTMVRIAT